MGQHVRAEVTVSEMGFSATGMGIVFDQAARGNYHKSIF